MNIGSGGSPYVHSNVNNFMSNVSTDLGESIVTKSSIENSIKDLQSISASLKEAAKQFLMGIDTTLPIDQILKMPDTFAGIATDIIQSPDIIDSLVMSPSVGYLSKSQLPKEFNSGKIGEIVKQEIDSLDEVIPVEQFAKIIGASLGDKNGYILVDLDVGVTITDLFSFDPSIQKRIEDECKKGYFKRLSRSHSQSGIVKKIIELLSFSSMVNKYNESQLLHTFDKFWAAFTREFRTRIEKYNFWPADYTPEDYLKDLEEPLRKVLAKDIKDPRNAAGKINEDILMTVQNADNLITLKFTATGTKKDPNIVEMFPSLHTMNTHHGLTKQSQTDMIIENKNGMVVRAQSKTSRNEYIIDLDEGDGKTVSTYRILNHLQRSMNIYTLLNKLNETSFLPIPNIDEICYAIANSLWFHTHKSVSGHRAVGYFSFELAKTKDFLPEVVRALNAALAQQAPSFLGISVEKTEKEIIADAQGSNIFYIENGNLIPTYLQLDEIIRDLQAYYDAAQNVPQMLKFYIDDGGNKTAWAYPGEVGFWCLKVDNNKYNSAPGYAQGAAAIKSTSLHGDFNALVRLDNYVLG